MTSVSALLALRANTIEFAVKAKFVKKIACLLYICKAKSILAYYYFESIVRLSFDLAVN